MNEIPENVFLPEIRILAAIVSPRALEFGAQIGRAVQDEKQFFASLGNVNAAAVRDYLVANARDLQAYTRQLNDVWEAIVKQEEEIHEDEQESYKEIQELVKEAARQLAEDRKTLQEKAAEIAATVFKGASNLGSLIEWLLKLPDGAGWLIEKIMEWAKERTEAWVKWNQYLKERADKYLRLVEQEKGGVLPVFKQCRQQVYDYWNEKGTKTSRVWLDTARSSLDTWKSSCPTSGQRDDADRFSADVYALIQQHWTRIEEIGKAFEEKWNGVFQGALQPTTQDKLTDAIAWKQNTETLIDVGVVELVKTFLKDSDEIYGASFTEPLRQLQEAAEKLPDEDSKGDALRALADLRNKIQSELSDRLKAMQQQIDQVGKQLEPGSIQKMFDRSEIENLVL